MLRKKIKTKSGRKIKNRFKLNELILYIYSNSFCLFFSIIQGLKNLKKCKILIIFNLLLYVPW